MTAQANFRKVYTNYKLDIFFEPKSFLGPKQGSENIK